MRVGDPNQAIFETFTTANPALLRDFIARNPSVDMPESGRCQPSIMDLANYLIDWVMDGNIPLPEARDALSPPYIDACPARRPQPNPPDDPAGIELISHASSTPDEEVKRGRGIPRSLAAGAPGFHRGRPHVHE